MSLRMFLFTDSGGSRASGAAVRWSMLPVGAAAPLLSLHGRSTMLTGYYETPLVLISILVAIVASYSALSLAGRVTRIARPRHARLDRRRRHRHGLGHLGHALRRHAGVPPADPDRLRPAASPWSRCCCRSPPPAWRCGRSAAPTWAARAWPSARVLMGIGINAMHYTGMAAMRMEPGIVYDPLAVRAVGGDRHRRVGAGAVDRLPPAPQHAATCGCRASAPPS